MASEAKARGISAFKEGAWVLAEREFSAAIQLAGRGSIQMHVYHSNRAAARMHLHNWVGAEEDARECTKLSPSECSECRMRIARPSRSRGPEGGRSAQQCGEPISAAVRGEPIVKSLMLSSRQLTRRR